MIGSPWVIGSSAIVHALWAPRSSVFAFCHLLGFRLKYATALKLGTAEAAQVLRRFTRSGPKHPTVRPEARALIARAPVWLRGSRKSRRLDDAVGRLDSRGSLGSYRRLGVLGGR